MSRPRTTPFVSSVFQAKFSARPRSSSPIEWRVSHPSRRMPATTILRFCLAMAAGSLMIAAGSSIQRVVSINNSKCVTQCGWANFTERHSKFVSVAQKSESQMHLFGASRLAFRFSDSRLWELQPGHLWGRACNLPSIETHHPKRNDTSVRRAKFLMTVAHGENAFRPANLNVWRVRGGPVPKEWT